MTSAVIISDVTCPARFRARSGFVLLLLMPSTSLRSACLTSLGLPQTDSGRPYWIPSHRRLRMVCLQLYSLLGIAGYAGIDVDCGPWGGRGTPRTIACMSTAFATVIAPLCTALASLVKAWRNWCTVLTWAATRHSLNQIPPCLLPSCRPSSGN
jgi:hypothetical protein